MDDDFDASARRLARLGVEDDREGRQHERIDRAGHPGAGP